jgi:hypothetical protein
MFVMNFLKSVVLFVFSKSFSLFDIAMLATIFYTGAWGIILIPITIIASVYMDSVVEDLREKEEENAMG